MGLFWGLLLIGAGVVALGQQLGYIQQFTDPKFWIWVFALISFAAVVEYAMSGWKEWGWLFPAGVFGGLALVITLATNNVDSAAVASPLFIGLLIPFAAAYLTDRTRNWWALIPGGVMLFLALTTLLVDNTGGEWVGVMFLLMFAIAFLVVYLINHTRTWALLVAYIFGVLSLAPMLAAIGDMAGYFGSVLMFAIALPFFIVYSVLRRQLVGHHSRWRVECGRCGCRACHCWRDQRHHEWRNCQCLPDGRACRNFLRHLAAAPQGLGEDRHHCARHPSRGICILLWLL